MHDPMKTSSTLSPATSLNSADASGSLGSARMGSLISSMLISMISAYSALGSASMRSGWASQSSIRAIRRSSVRGSPYPSDIIHLSMTTLELRYSITGSLLSLMVHPAALRSAEASDSSNACSHLRSGRPSISRTRPENTLILPFFSVVSSPFLSAVYGIACTRSRRVMPGCIFPVNLTRTDSGMSSGKIPVAAANATRPDPAGNETPNGNRVWESPPVPTVSGTSILFSHEWMIPSPGLRLTPPLVWMKSGSVWCVTTSTGLGYAAV
mmetsp:Transcript_29789/g.71970  ORF Transcript_29789/g.71970 Transcript_29789/m.71970 type:complete len:268 (+) Transcript_29789:643-1446(+)